LGYRFASYPGLELLGGLVHVEPESDSGLENETRLSAGLRYNFGGKGSNSYTNLFPEDSGKLRPRMRLEDASAVSGTNSITLQGRKNIGRENVTVNAAPILDTKAPVLSSTNQTFTTTV